MRSPTAPTVVKAPADGDPEALAGWCAATQDLMAFRNALRRVAPERWLSVRSRLAESLGGRDSVGVEPPLGNAAERDRRGRAAARVHKLQMLQQLDASRTDRDRSRREEKAPEPTGSP
jgi:hypothetical protein